MLFRGSAATCSCFIGAVLVPAVLLLREGTQQLARNNAEVGLAGGIRVLYVEMDILAWRPVASCSCHPGNRDANLKTAAADVLHEAGLPFAALSMSQTVLLRHSQAASTAVAFGIEEEDIGACSFIGLH